LIRVSLVLGPEGCLQQLHAAGHAARAGNDFSPACAAVTVLLRTSAELFDAEDGLETDILLPEEGILDINIGKVPGNKRDRCKGITDFLLFGLLRIARENPTDLLLEISDN
jgi:uncharacterized protein YsxB (DUF464 family)